MSPVQAPVSKQLPIAARYRVRYAKRGRLRFASHRDFQRSFERAIRRAGVPIAFSHGFTPHPRISYAGAAPTGAASEAEYLEIALTEVREPAEIAGLLDESLPEGFDIMTVVRAEGGNLVDGLLASRWRIEVPGQDWDQAVLAYLASESATIERMTKKGPRQFDTRPAVADLRLAPAEREDWTALELLLLHQTPSVRADDVLGALCDQADTPVPAGALYTRLAQGSFADTDSRPSLDDALLDPLGL